MLIYDTLRAEQKSMGKDVARAQGDEREALLARSKQLGDAGQGRRGRATRRRGGASGWSRWSCRTWSSPGCRWAARRRSSSSSTWVHRGTSRRRGSSRRTTSTSGSSLGAIDVERGAKVSGARFFYLTGPGALLELALVNLAVAQAVAAGFVPMVPPVLVKPPAMEGTGFLGQAAENVFHLEQDDFYLVGTSEVPLAAYHMDEILEEPSLPLRYAGLSSCFRREAGTYGKDTRGIIRVHQFDKVEMFTFCRPEDAEDEHRRLLAWERQFLDVLELPYRVIDVASGDLGSSAVRKFDCEAWIPTQGKYREVTSTSNCTTFQARRLNVRMRDGDTVGPVATLNGTLVAIPRVIVAILENNQQADGSVRVPTALQPYLGTDLLAPLT